MLQFDGSQEATPAAETLCDGDPIPLWLDCDTGRTHHSFIMRY
jgi:hypothetical protein